MTPTDAAHRAPSTGGDHADGTPSGANGDGGLGSQPDPRRLFVRDPLPSTASAGTSTAAPASGQPAGGGDGARDRSASGQRADEGEIQPTDSGGGDDRRPQQHRADSAFRNGESRLARQHQEEGAEAEEGSEQAETGDGGGDGPAVRTRSRDLRDDEVCS